MFSVQLHKIERNAIKLITKDDLAILHLFDDLYVFIHINIFYFIIFQACRFSSELICITLLSFIIYIFTTRSIKNE